MSEQQKMDQERAAFEAWYLREIEDGQDSLIKYPNGHYINDTTMDAWYGWQARASLPVGVPDGYALVPVEPTQAMTEAGMAVDVAMYETHYCETQAIYEAMLAAAPAAQATAEQGDQSDNIKHLTHCDDDGCERCVNLMYFYQACDECGAWGHNDSGPCLCTKTAEQSAPGEVEEVERIGYAWINRYNDAVDHVAPFPPTDGGVSYGEPLMTVAQHERIVAHLAARDAGEARVPVELEPLIDRLDRVIEVFRECERHASSYSGCIDGVEEHGGDDHEDPICAVFHRLYYAMFDADAVRKELRALLAQRERGGE